MRQNHADSRDDDGSEGPGRRTTRRRALQATAVGVGAITALGGRVMAGNGGCDVPESERQAVRDEYADLDLVLNTLEQQEGVIQALQAQNLVEGTTEGVLVYAPVVDCEPVPEYRIFRRTAAGGYLTIAMRPQTSESVASYTPGGGDGGEQNPPCQNVVDNCWIGCEQDDCCECEFSTNCGCENFEVACDPYCCYRARWECDGFTCLKGCGRAELAPDPVDLADQDLIECILGGC